MERHYEGSNILFLEPRAHSMLYRYISVFLTFIVDLPFGKTLNAYMRRVTVSIVGTWLARNIGSPTHLQKIPFCKCPGECPLKNTEQSTSKKLLTTIICKLFCTKID